MKKVAVILSGCGVYDGAEIHESVLTLLALSVANVEYQCLAPNINQTHVINHVTGDICAGEVRNLLVESARIARGDIKDLASVVAEDFSAAIVPGGFGAAKNLCDFAFKGVDCTVNPDVYAFISALSKQNKPLGFICIAPAMIPKIIHTNVACTIGTDKNTADAIKTMGANHQDCSVENIIVDEVQKVISTPAYMLAKNPHQAYLGISKLVNKVIELIE